MLVGSVSTRQQKSAKGRYSPAECTGIKKTVKIGKPKKKDISTSYAERQNLTMPMSMLRSRA
jgi:hypothetical protein